MKLNNAFMKRIGSQITDDPYGPAIHPIVADWIVPDRRLLYFFRYHWPHYRAFFFILLVIFTVIPAFGLPVTMLLAASYGLWLLVSRPLERSPTPQTRHRVRHLAGLIFASALILADLTLHPSDESLLWLLYLVPVLSVGIALARGAAFGVIGAASFLTATSSITASLLIGAPNLGAAAMIATAKSLAIGYVGLTSYIIARSLAYDQHHAKTLSNLLTHIHRATDDEFDWNHLCMQIGELFNRGSDEVMIHLLRYMPHNHTLEVAASSSPKGQQQARNHYAFDIKYGITGWVVQTGKSCFLDNVENDPHQRFFRHDDFPDVKAAIALPIRRNNKVIYVLDAESNRPNAFGYEDRQSLEVVAALIETSLEQQRNLKTHTDLARLATDIATDVIGEHDLERVLDDIGNVAIDVLQAHLVGYYIKDHEAGVLKRYPTIGKRDHPEVYEPDTIPNSFAERLMQMDQIRLFPYAQHEPELLEKTQWHEDNGEEVFVIREGVISAAAMPLLISNQAIGLMFINFRQFQSFPDELRHLISLLASLAALAIQSCIREAAVAAEQKRVTAEQKRRAKEELGHDQHDLMSGYLRRANQSLTALAKLDLTDEMLRHIQVARGSIKLAQVNINRLESGADVTFATILEDLTIHSKTLEKIHKISICLSSLPLATSTTPLIPWASKELYFAVVETFSNAVEHSNAHLISVEFDFQHMPKWVTVIVQDNGTGFDINALSRKNGIINLQERIKNLQGIVRFDSALERGTTVEISVPLFALIDSLS